MITAAVACLFTAISVSHALPIWLFERPPAISRKIGALLAPPTIAQRSA